MKKLFTALAVTAILVGCSSTPSEKTVNLMVEMQNVKQQYNNSGVPAGLGVGVSQDEQIAYEKADQNARVDLAKTLESQVKALTENFKEDVGDEISQHFQTTTSNRVNTTLNGATLTDVKMESTEDGHYKVYGVMTLKSNLVEEFIQMLEEQGKKAEAEKVRASAKKAYERLDEKVK